MKKEEVGSFVESFFENDHTGHGLDHLHRVVKMSQFLAQEEGMSPLEKENIYFLAWLHEMLDKKFFPNETLAKEQLTAFFKTQGLSEEEEKFWIKNIQGISFSKRTEENNFPLWVKIVQDADLLDAIGAIGIGRTFMYGATHGSLMYDPQKAGIKDSSILQHFDDKLLKIPDLLSTSAGKEIGQERKQIMLDFLKAFKKEWEGQ